MEVEKEGEGDETFRISYNEAEVYLHVKVGR